MGISKKIITMGTVMLLTFNGSSIVQAEGLEIKEGKLAGEDRYKTAIEVSKAGWSTASKAILVNGTALADALSVAPLADEYNAPVLLTEKDKLNTDTLNELKRLGVKEVTIIGGTSVISSLQEETLKSNGITVKRIAGNSRYETSTKIAETLKPLYEAKGKRKTVFIANGAKGLVDATSVSSPAGIKDAYILYSNGSNLDGIKSFIETSADDVYLIGGTSVISQGIENELKSTTNKAIYRINGTDRKDTNAKVIEKFFPQKDINTIYVAKDGMAKENELVDALAVGSLSSMKNSPILISSGNLGSTQRNMIIDKDIKNVIQVGEGANKISVKEIIDLKTKGMSFSDFRNRLPEIGWTLLGDTTYTYMENSARMGQVNVEDNGAYFVLSENTPSFDSTIKTCFNLLLPTKGNELYNIVSKPFSDQTFKMDGRNVSIRQGQAGVYVHITN